jgi:hypothetical protein
MKTSCIKKALKPVLATGRTQDETDARTVCAWRSPNQPAAVAPPPWSLHKKPRTWNRPGRQQTKQGATARCTSRSFPFFHPDYTVGVGMGRSCIDCSTAPHSCIRHNGKRAGAMACRCRHGPSARGLVDGSTYRRSGIGVAPSPCPEGCYEICLHHSQHGAARQVSRHAFCKRTAGAQTRLNKPFISR